MTVTVWVSRMVMVMGIPVVGVRVNGRGSISNDAAASSRFHGRIRSVGRGHHDALSDDGVFATDVLQEFRLNPRECRRVLTVLDDGLGCDRASAGVGVRVRHAVDELREWVELFAAITALIAVIVRTNVAVHAELEAKDSVSKARGDIEGSSDGRGMAWHLSDLQDIVETVSIGELADAVGGLEELGRDVRNLRRRVLLVRGPPTLRLVRVPGLHRVVRMTVRAVAIAVSVARRSCR